MIGILIPIGLSKDLFAPMDVAGIPEFVNLDTLMLGLMERMMALVTTTVSLAANALEMILRLQRMEEITLKATEQRVHIKIFDFYKIHAII